MELWCFCCGVNVVELVYVHCEAVGSSFSSNLALSYLDCYFFISNKRNFIIINRHVPSVPEVYKRKNLNHSRNNGKKSKTNHHHNHHLIQGPQPKNLKYQRKFLLSFPIERSLSSKHILFISSHKHHIKYKLQQNLISPSTFPTCKKVYHLIRHYPSNTQNSKDLIP